MPASTVESYLNGTGKFEDINKKDWDDYVAEQQRIQKELTVSSKNSSNTMSAMRVRPVNAQAAASKNANSSNPVPSKPMPPPTFSATDSSALNKMRFVYSGNPYVAITNYGPNSYIPDANLYMMISNECDRLLVNTRKFTEISEFWTPLHSKYYDSVIFIVSAMRSAATVRSVGREIQDVLDLFEGPNAQYPLASVPVLGPQANTLSSLASSLPHLLDLDPIAPWLPQSPESTAATYFLLNNNTSMRLPAVPLFLNQLGYIHDTATDLSATRWNNLYLHSVYGVDLRRQTTTGTPTPIDSTRFDESYQLLTTTSAHISRQINSPGVLPVFFGSSQFTRFNEYRLAVSPPTYVPTGTVSPADSLTWTQFLGLHDPYFFQSILRVMSLRAKFFKGSVSLADIAPSGNTAGQVVADVVSKRSLASRLSHRYSNQTWTFNSVVRNPLSPDSDLFDAAIAPVNISHLPASTNGYNTGTTAPQGNETNMATHRLGGYFFENIPRCKRATAQNPTGGYGTVVTSHFYSPVPLREL